MTTTGYTDVDATSSQGQGACVAGASTAEVLRLLSAGATGAILMALGEGPLRTKNLTEQVPGYAARTIYRYAGKLAELAVVEREEEPGVPSKVVHRLTSPCGTDLYELVNRFADSSLTRLPDGGIDAHAWASLGLLADLWEAGMVEELSCGSKSPTDLARGPHGLSYHQVNRRAGLFKAGGLLSESQSSGRRRCYELTEKARRKMGLIASIARWRHHHVVDEGEEGMAADEMATLLRAALPLVKVPEHKGKRLRLEVHAGDGEDAAGQSVWADVEGDGTVSPCAGALSATEGSGGGEVEGWISVVLDGDPRGVLVDAGERFVSDCLDGLYGALWTPNPF